jgi:hypothetical protein
MQPTGNKTENGQPARGARKSPGRCGLGKYLQRLAMLGAMLVVTAVLLWYGLIVLLVYRAD